MSLPKLIPPQLTTAEVATVRHALDVAARQFDADRALVLAESPALRPPVGIHRSLAEQFARQAADTRAVLAKFEDADEYETADPVRDGWVDKRGRP